MESNPNTIAEAALRELNRKLTEERAEDNGFAQFVSLEFHNDSLQLIIPLVLGRLYGRKDIQT